MGKISNLLYNNARDSKLYLFQLNLFKFLNNVSIGLNYTNKAE